MKTSRSRDGMRISLRNLIKKSKEPSLALGRRDIECKRSKSQTNRSLEAGGRSELDYVMPIETIGVTDHRSFDSIANLSAGLA